MPQLTGKSFRRASIQESAIEIAGRAAFIVGSDWPLW
jgi:predicted TIM-barrel fold metal-dependent hydrolase